MVRKTFRSPNNRMQLPDYVNDYGVGVNPVASFELKRLDSDYFSEAL